MARGYQPIDLLSGATLAVTGRRPYESPVLGLVEPTLAGTAPDATAPLPARPSGPTPIDGAPGTEKLDMLELAPTPPSVELSVLRREVDHLRFERQLAHREAQRIAAEAIADPATAFLLVKIAERGEVTGADLAANLAAPTGWVAFASLWRAGLVDYLADRACVTEAGGKLADALLRAESMPPNGR